VLVVTPTLVTACGSGGSSRPSASRTTRAEDVALAQRAVLRLADLPSGFRAVKTDSPSGFHVTPALTRRFAECSQSPISDVQALLSGKTAGAMATANSPTFLSRRVGPAQQSLGNFVLVADSTAAQQRLFALVRRATTHGCWKSFFERFGTTTVTPIRSFDVGDESTGIRVNVRVSEHGRAVPTTADLLFVRRGRAAVSLDALWVSRSVERPMERALLQKVVDRLDAAA
jgi:hypothetical protein